MCAQKPAILVQQDDKVQYYILMTCTIHTIRLMTLVLLDHEGIDGRDL
jgi:hypothetical protein